MGTMLMAKDSMDFAKTPVPPRPPVEHRPTRPVSFLSFIRTKLTEDVLMLPLSMEQLGVPPRFTQMEWL